MPKKPLENRVLEVCTLLIKFKYINAMLVSTTCLGQQKFQIVGIKLQRYT